MHQHLEKMDPPGGTCQCGKPGQYFYWGMNTIVCSETCADAIDKEVNDYFEREHAKDTSTTAPPELE